MKAVLSRDDYRTFTQKVQVLESKGYDLPHIVEHIKDNDTFAVTIHGNHDVNVLDGLTDEN